jgi:hypothetical protein
MEKGLRTAVAGLLLCLVAAGAAAQDGPAKWIKDFEKKFPPLEKNAAAVELERLSLALGLDPYGEAGDEHPLKADRDAYLQAAFGTWLDSQLKTSDDSIGLPPPRLAEFLDTRQATVWRVVTLLGREVPEWGFDLQKGSRPMPEMLLVISLTRILVGAALVEERSGHHMQAADLLEGSWSLYRSVASSPDQIFQIIGLAVLKLQAGALRKLSEPAYGWVERLASEEPKERMLESLQSEPLTILATRSVDSPDDHASPWIRGWQAVADELRKLSACEISHRSDEEIWKPAMDIFRKWNEAGGNSSGNVVQEMAQPNQTGTLRRLARLMVDRELTAKILQLRIEKAAARPNRWPDKFFDADSMVCPGATYEYRSSGSAMSIRFAGSVASPEMPLVLPLSFDARAPSPTPAPSRSPRPTPTPAPRPTLTPARARA